MRQPAAARKSPNVRLQPSSHALIRATTVVGAVPATSIRRRRLWHRIQAHAVHARLGAISRISRSPRSSTTKRGQRAAVPCHRRSAAATAPINPEPRRA
jgi:hypothetical protein